MNKKFENTPSVEENPLFHDTISKIVHIDAKTETATPLINTGIMAVFHSTKCQRWDYNILLISK